VANMAKAVSLRMVNFMIVVMVSVLLLFMVFYAASTTAHQIGFGFGK
jgi:hypothetical protein